MKVKKIKKRGEEVWLVDGTINGKRKRMFFESEPKAKQWLAAETKDTTCQQWWLDLSNADRVDMMNAFERSRSEGFSLMDAVQGHSVNGCGVTHLKRMTLEEAIGFDGVDRRFKKTDTRPSPSGFLGVKKLTGIQPNSLSTLKCQLYNFRDYCGGNLQCKAVTSQMILDWLLAGGVDKKNWQKVSYTRYANAVKLLFDWLINQEVIAEGKNPARKVPKFNEEAFDPKILDPEQCRKVLRLCHEKHFDVLPLLVFNLFCGIRPSETRRLEFSTSFDRRKNNLDFEDKEVRFQARRTKTKMPRIVSMSDNCLAWLNCHKKIELPITNANHRWNKFLRDARKELCYDLWPHDCLRHSFCSYALRKYEDFGKVAAQAGHTERIALKHYLKQVSKAEAEEFWNIYPEDVGTQFQPVAA